jgi:hypothetical protein
MGPWKICRAKKFGWQLKTVKAWSGPLFSSKPLFFLAAGCGKHSIGAQRHAGI